MLKLLNRKTKRNFESELQVALETIAYYEDKHRQVLAETAWWKDQLLQYANQIQFWQQKNREILDQLAKDNGNVNLRAYISDVQEEIVRAAPRAAEIAAVIAMAGKDTQGIAAIGFVDPKLSRPALPPIDLEQQA